jgi:uncharacterized protein
MQTLCANFPEVELVYLFGSQATQKATKASDMDIALFLDPSSCPIVITRKAELLAAVEDHFRSNHVDVTFLNTAGSVLKYEVLKHGKLLFERNPGTHKKFQLRTWKEFFDFKPVLDFFYRRKIVGHG